MAKAIFTTKKFSSYDDLPEMRYHFPKRYLPKVSQAVGDWIVYYEPRRPSVNLMRIGGRKAYFATARLEKITHDPVLPDHFYAEMSNYLEFSRPVPFSENGYYFESALKKADGSTNKGAFGQAVRMLPDAEYDSIWRAGFGHIIGTEVRLRSEPDMPEEPWPPIGKFADERAFFSAEVEFDVQREIINQLVSRPFRDRAFATAVKTAYGDKCAISGLKIINGGGRSEVQAAHIKPVSELGPDSVRNGIALSGTVHWMFDRGLISIDEDMTILCAKDRLPEPALALIHPGKKILLPNRNDMQPHPMFLEYHRGHIFKG